MDFINQQSKDVYELLEKLKNKNKNEVNSSLLTNISSICKLIENKTITTSIKCQIEHDNQLSKNFTDTNSDQKIIEEDFEIKNYLSIKLEVKEDLGLINNIEKNIENLK